MFLSLFHRTSSPKNLRALWLSNNSGGALTRTYVKLCHLYVNVLFYKKDLQAEKDPYVVNTFKLIAVIGICGHFLRYYAHQPMKGL